MATCKRGNSIQEDTHCQNVTEQRNLDTLAYKIKCKWENQEKKGDLGWVGEGEQHCT
jgi:hypothetical protein